MPDKKVLDTLQIIALFIALVGGAFKLLHWPGANILLITGIGTLSVYYILMGFVTTATNQIAVYLNYNRNFSIAVLLMGVLFYMMHWPSARLMLMVGAVSFAIGFIAQIAFGNKQEGE